MSAKTSLRGVLLADIVGSRRVEDLRSQRDRTLREASERHRNSGWISAPYAVTAWDEFQSVSEQIKAVPLVIFDLRCSFYPLELRIAVGVGGISSMPSKGEPLNEAATGEAFEKAREVMEDLKSSKSKYRTLTGFRSPDADLDRTVNLIYGLHDTLLQRITPKQWDTILARTASGDQEETAKRLGGIGPSTVSRSLQRGFFWQIEDTRKTLSWLLGKNFG